jgi:uncharacterized protein YukE
MNGNGVRVNSQSIRQLSKNLIDETNKLVQMIETARVQVEDSKNSYDSASASGFRNKMNSFAENAKKGTSENLNNLAAYFESVASLYDNQDESIQEAANQYLTTDLFD